MMLSGVPSMRKIGSHSTVPTTVSTTPSTATEIKPVYAAVFISLKSFAPKSCEMTTEIPMFMPNATAMKIIVTGYEAPTAANASSPANLPAMTLSAIL